MVKVLTFNDLIFMLYKIYSLNFEHQHFEFNVRWLLDISKLHNITFVYLAKFFDVILEALEEGGKKIEITITSMTLIYFNIFFLYYSPGGKKSIFMITKNYKVFLLLTMYSTLSWYLHVLMTHREPIHV